MPDANLHIKRVGDACTLFERPEVIWIQPGGTVTWTIHGDCAGEITIDRFKPNRDPFDDPNPATASNRQKVVMKVHEKGPADGNKRWTYEVLLNGNPIPRAFKAERSDEFALYVCPSWPCTWPIKLNEK